MSDSDKVLQFQKMIYDSYTKRDLGTLRTVLTQYSIFLRRLSDTVLNKSITESVKLIKLADKYSYIADLLSKEGLSERICLAIEGRGELELPKKATPAPSSSAQPMRTSGQPSNAGAGYAHPKVTVVPDPNWGARMFDQFLPAVTTIETETGAGTGFFISNNGYMLTNHHVVYCGNTPSRSIHITSGDGKINCTASLIDADKDSDVALLHLNNFKKQTPFIPMIPNFSSVRPGDAVMVIGNALGIGLSPEPGTVKFPKSKNLDENLLYSASTNCGDSGSPLINSNGMVIGVNKASWERSDNTEVKDIAVATNGDKVKSLLAQWQRKHKLSFNLQK